MPDNRLLFLPPVLYARQLTFCFLLTQQIVANLEQEDNVSLAGDCPPRILTKINF
ncbi:hypothetical protein ACLB1N_21830 [Escherichia coli]